MQEFILTILPNNQQERIVSTVNRLQAGQFIVGFLAEKIFFFSLQNVQTGLALYSIGTSVLSFMVKWLGQGVDH